MPSKKFLMILFACAAISGLLTAGAWAGSPEKVLHIFDYLHGAEPFTGSLVFDSEGNLYGTALYGANRSCSGGCGTVFQLVPSSSGKWTQKVLHDFGGGSDGFQPNGTLIFDSAGNLYGVTIYGGNNSCSNGCGTVYKLAPGVSGKWIKTVLHVFSGKDGAFPFDGLTFDGAGNLYGTTQQGGKYQGCPQNGCGVVFKLTPGTQGKWTETVVHAFNGSDGSVPTGTLIFDKTGTLYGMTQQGGNYNACPGYGCGLVFKLTPHTQGQWTETVLHAYRRNDGLGPFGTLALDKAGNLYGVTGLIGRRYGMVFKLARGPDGKWKQTVLHVFSNRPADYPTAGVTLDAAGNLYGMTSRGGLHDLGTVYKLTAGSTGKWTFQVLHIFNGKDGVSPQDALILDAMGNLYGTTSMGGNFRDCPSNGCGVVFKITP